MADETISLVIEPDQDMPRVGECIQQQFEDGLYLVTIEHIYPSTVQVRIQDGAILMDVRGTKQRIEEQGEEQASVTQSPARG